MNKYFFFLFFFLVQWMACKRDHEPEHTTSTPYVIAVPKGFPPPLLSAFNPMTAEGVELGRSLFYDDILSSNGRSCSSCHKQENSFMVKNSDLGLDPDKYPNIPPLVNLAWNPDYGWYGGEPDLDHVAIGDFGPMFFNSDLNTVIEKVSSDKKYQTLFKKIFPGQNVFTPASFPEKTAMVLAQFLRSIISSNSKYDRVRNGKDFFTQEEKYGFELFTTEKGDCFHCHSAPLFTDNVFHNIGLDSFFTGFKRGKFIVTGNESDKGKFSTPGLRNIALTAPYMHDGRFETLEEVIEHYNSGVKHSATLDPIMTKAGKENGLHLSAFDKQCLVKFLHTLTDTVVTKDPAYAKPD